MSSEQPRKVIKIPKFGQIGLLYGVSLAADCKTVLSKGGWEIKNFFFQQ